MAATNRRGGYGQTTCFLVALCWHLASTVATEQSCTLETDFKDDDFPCRKWLHCRQPTDWTSLSAEIKTKSENDRLCAIVVDCANTVTISNFDFQTIGGQFGRVLNVTISRCNATQVSLADDMYLVVELGLDGNAFDSLDFLKDWQSTEFEVLDFHNNRLRTVRQTDFANFNHLSSLRLDANHITDVAANSFLNNHELVSVNLANNRLQTVGERMFAGMDALKIFATGWEQNQHFGRRNVH
ncbi:hypothetical protein NP493_1795g00007 [Ridgeia piscesae]|uniref:Uncharacterized protein n=1 Tax=Ridgeia piscesae TaxID=27915 RepID=A0AAD9N6D7_RIDPI|nr:hypothetical protein NP493_1795g00007 [Ridgeia piscesae]